MTRQRTYVGHSGQMAVMAELLFLECNVAIPEVDYGTDVFAFHDEREEVARIQVKTARGERYKTEEGYRAQFDLPMKQLLRPNRPPLYYVLATRLADRWADFLIVSRPRLSELWNGPLRFGTPNKASGNLVLTVQFRPTNVLCGEVDLTSYRNAWDTLPPVLVPDRAAKEGDLGETAGVSPEQSV